MSVLTFHLMHFALKLRCVQLQALKIVLDVAQRGQRLPRVRIRVMVRVKVFVFIPGV